MQKKVVVIYKSFRWLIIKLLKPLDYVMSFVIFYTNGVQFSSFYNSGWPLINIGIGGSCSIGKGFHSNNREGANPIGRFNKCSIIVGNKGKLIIGSNVGMSSTAIVCHHSIFIGDNVKIGGNVVIYDTDFHSVDANDRLSRSSDINSTRKLPVKISNNAFIGAHSTILKGVTIGENAVIGACSVVTKSIPANEIWAGNPAKFLKKIEINN